MQIKELAQQVVLDTVLNHYALSEAFLQDLVNKDISRDEIIRKYHQSSLDIFALCINDLTAKKPGFDRKQILAKYARMKKLLKWVG